MDLKTLIQGKSRGELMARMKGLRRVSWGAASSENVLKEIRMIKEELDRRATRNLVNGLPEILY